MSDNRSEDPKYVQWAKAVKVRDSYKCQICGAGGDYKTSIDAHHKDSWDWAVNSRYDIKNGTSLCEHHHMFYHKFAGFGKNTKEHFDNFIKMHAVFKNILDNDIEFQKTAKIAKIFVSILSSDQLKSSLKEASEIKENLNIPHSYEETKQEEDSNEKGEE